MALQSDDDFLTYAVISTIRLRQGVDAFSLWLLVIDRTLQEPDMASILLMYAEIRLKQLKHWQILQR